MAGRSIFGSDIKGEAVTALQKAYNEKDNVGGDARYKTALKDFEAGDFGKALEDLQRKTPTSNKSSSAMGNNNTSAPTVHVEVSVHPKHAQQFTAAVKAGTGSYQTGKTAPNYQPTRTSIVG